MKRAMLLAATVVALVLSLAPAPAQAVDNFPAGSSAAWNQMNYNDDPYQVPAAKLWVYSSPGAPTKFDQSRVTTSVSYFIAILCDKVTVKIKSATGTWGAMSASMGGVTSCSNTQVVVDFAGLPKGYQVRVIVPTRIDAPIDRPAIPERVYYITNMQNWLNGTEVELGGFYGVDYLYLNERPLTPPPGQI